jgi:uncharacterized protein (DUF2249 family)
MAEKNNKVPITPETKIGAFLDAYPELEVTLIELAPAFGKLRNPALRRTVAKVATLRQAAKVGGVELGELINTLRRAAGQKTSEAVSDEAGAREESKPDWVSEGDIANSIDVRPMLDRGEQPISLVMTELSKLPQGKILELIAPFVPAPLIDKAHSRGYRTWYDEANPRIVRVYFGRSSD